MGYVESADTNDPIQHSNKNLEIKVPVIVKELRSVQFREVTKRGWDSV